MGSLVPTGTVGWGLQLPVQAQSTLFAQPWEATAGPAELVAIARAADRAGALYVGVCDHVAIPAPHHEVMNTTWYDTVATMGWLAALTTSVNVASHVLVLPYRHPLAVAKAFTTLDALSGGRAVLGVGAGHVAEEFGVLGADFGSRGSIVEDSVRTIRRVFEAEFVDVETVGDDTVQVGDTVQVAVSPRPVRPGGPPIWVGGSSSAAIRRAALLGDGWLPQGPAKMGLTAAVDFIRSTRADAGLPEAFDIGATAGPVYVGDPAGVGGGFRLPDHAMTGDPDQIAARIRRLTARGVNQVQLQFQGVDAYHVSEQIERFGAEVAPLLAG